MVVWFTIWMVGCMQKVKTTLVVDKRLLDQFKKLTSMKRGTSKALSTEFEEALRAFSPMEIISSLIAALSLKIDQYPSLGEVAKNRPRVKISAGRIVREMRDEREQRILGHKHHRQEIH